jgi:hypothetical protein
MNTELFTLGLLAILMLAGNAMAGEDYGCGDLELPPFHDINPVLTQVQAIMETISDEYEVEDVEFYDGEFEIVVRQSADIAGTALKATVKSFVGGEFTETASYYRPHIDAAGRAHLFVSVPEGAAESFIITIEAPGFFGQYRAYVAGL